MNTMAKQWFVAVTEEDDYPMLGSSDSTGEWRPQIGAEVPKDCLRDPLISGTLRVVHIFRGEATDFINVLFSATRAFGGERGEHTFVGHLDSLVRTCWWQGRETA